MVKFGQHFLKDKKLLKKISSYANISENDVIVEIGSGDGRLTKNLVNAKKIYAVEIDEFIFNKLEQNLEKYKNIECINMDVLNWEFPEDVNKIIGNLPYEISAPITEKILVFLNKQKNKGIKNLLAILMYQKEFAERMTSIPGLRSWSRLSVLVNYYSDCEILKNIPRTAFRPAPKIESSLVKLVPKKVEHDKEILKVAKILFLHKNKKVINSLIDSRKRFLKIKDKNKLRKIISEKLGDYADKRVVFLEVKEIKKIKEDVGHIFK